MSTGLGFEAPSPDDRANLPPDFLRIDAGRLAESARRTRSMADLQVGLGGLAAHSGVANAVIDGYEKLWENGPSGDHIRRGAALTWGLLSNSVPGFNPDAAGYRADMASLEPQPNERREAFQATRARLIELRRRAMPAPQHRLSEAVIAERQAAFMEVTDVILEQSGLGGAFDEALTHLTGAGLEEPTRPADAKYGAALVALAIGAIES